MSIRIQEQILFEIAMSLGTSLDLDTMLSNALGTYLRRLCCMGVTVYLKTDDLSPYSINFSIPRKRDNKTLTKVFLDKINTDNETKLTELYNKIPIYIQQEGNHYYLMELPGAGFMLLEKGLTPLSRSLLKSLQQINVKLTESILTCQTHRKNEILNMQLKKQLHDIKIIEADLIEERKKHQIIFENSPVGIVYYDRKGFITDCNQKYVEIMGSTREELIGFNSALYSSEIIRQKLGEALQGIPVKFEGEYTSVTGNRTAIIRSNFTPVTPGSNSTEVIVTVEEISQQ